MTWGWDSPSRVLADLVRAAGVVSFVVALDRGFVATALWALVLLGLTLLRVVPAPPRLDLATGMLLVVAAWCSLLDAYLRYAWLDVVVHAAATGLLTGAVHHGLAKAGVVPEPGTAAAVALRRPLLGHLVTATALGLALGVLWEVGEWMGHTYLDPHIQVGYRDTVGDLASGGVGAFVAALVLACRGRAPLTTPPPASRAAREGGTNLPAEALRG